MAAAARPAAGAEPSALMLPKPARAISKNAAPGTSTRPLTLQGASLISGQHTCTRTLEASSSRYWSTDRAKVFVDLKCA
jgi:hypothetical protein